MRRSIVSASFLGDGTGGDGGAADTAETSGGAIVSERRLRAANLRGVPDGTMRTNSAPPTSTRWMSIVRPSIRGGGNNAGGTME